MLENIVSAKFWEYEILGNSVAGILSAFAAFAALILVFRIFQQVVLSRLQKLSEKTATDIDDTLIKIVRSVRPPFYSFLAFYFALNFLVLDGFVQRVIEYVLIAWVIYQVIIAAQMLIDYAVRKGFRREDDPGAQEAVKTIGKITKGVLWILGFLFFLSNLGVNVSSVLAGLGIGGVAIALAAQNILGDLFSSFVIYFDKPFQPGDFIVVGEHSGTVEQIGIKTTRIRSPQGEEIVISNQSLTSARIQNFKKMRERRVVFSFGVIYETPREKLERIPGLMRDIIASVSDVRFDRAHFVSFGDSALNFEVVYYCTTADYRLYRDRNQEILFKIKDTFEREGISMAYPTQTVYLTKT